MWIVDKITKVVHKEKTQYFPWFGEKIKSLMCIISELCTCYTQNVDNSWISSEFDVIFMWKNWKNRFLQKKRRKKQGFN